MMFHIRREHFFYSSHVNFDIKHFVSVAENLIYSQLMSYVLNNDNIVFILLGDEDIKTSEVVVIAKPKIINFLIRMDLPI